MKSNFTSERPSGDKAGRTPSRRQVSAADPGKRDRNVGCPTHQNSCLLQMRCCSALSANKACSNNGPRSALLAPAWVCMLPCNATMQCCRCWALLSEDEPDFWLAIANITPQKNVRYNKTQPYTGICYFLFSPARELFARRRF